jgi:arylsulfatase A-like enzyme
MAAAALGSGTGGRPAKAAFVTQPPNVLIVVTDDQPRGTLSAMPATKHWLGPHGTRYPNAFVTTPLCCPSRSSILTGQYAHNHHVQDNTHPENLDVRSTMERYLQGDGYRTAIFGKYLNGPNLNLSPAYFSKYAIYLRSEDAYYNSRWNVNGDIRTIGEYGTTFVADKAMNFIQTNEKNDVRPWFLYLSTPAPHRPFVPEYKYRGFPFASMEPRPSMLETDKSDKPAYVQAASGSVDRAQKTRKKQLRTLLSVDDMMRRLHRHLVRLGEVDNTIVIFISDNGLSWSDHGLLGKRGPYTPSVMVPMLISYPPGLGQGTVDTRIVANIDLLPTVLQAAGISSDPRYPIDGRSLLDSSWSRDHILNEYQQEHGPTPTWAALRNDSYHYIEYYDETGAITFREYYDLVNDPFELVNLLGDGDPTNDPPNAAALSAQLVQDKQCSGSNCP